jgi:hypothetical protein
MGSRVRVPPRSPIKLSISCVSPHKLATDISSGDAPGTQKYDAPRPIYEARTLQEISSFCRAALPFLGMIYTPILTYEARADRWAMLRQVLSFGFFAALACVNILVRDKRGNDSSRWLLE